jgi:hypothetical protein
MPTMRVNSRAAFQSPYFSSAILRLYLGLYRTLSHVELILFS